ncbi:hypothetical protein H696_03989 [Fonticula alba]|uniref:Uncharacterized protein n=1 Tax=Fonticula alba TaxID=691883 RepID=A0A058Z7S9_FONAL|nr:hypothetical protein H696_03989 [Fonticula alba]KCV69567.1 hypothetical protein H696_03989 [Fonticula alba]|eukprot:XP_009496132.1 hypothetical protein H696_03989 [Fonticula alba]
MQVVHQLNAFNRCKQRQRETEATSTAATPNDSTGVGKKVFGYTERPLFPEAQNNGFLASIHTRLFAFWPVTSASTMSAESNIPGPIDG